MKKKDELNSDLEAGSPAYLLSTKWLNKYYRFLLFDQFNKGTPTHQIQIKDDHFKAKHPGPISNARDICERDEQRFNLYGTDTEKGQEKEYLDMYLDQGCK